MCTCNPRVIALMAEIEAIKINVEGMKATNQRYNYDGLPVPYGEQDFNIWKEKMDGITNALRALANDET